MTTKYNIGDEIWFMYNNVPTKGSVCSITINYLGEVIYTILEFEKSVVEKYTGHTKRDLLNSFLTEEDKL